MAAGLPGGRPASGPPDRRRPRTGPGEGSVMVARMLFAALLGALIGGAELVGRYQDKPASAGFSPSGLLYIAVNASASTAALIAAQAMGWGLALPDGAPAGGAAGPPANAPPGGPPADLPLSFIVR